MKPLREKWTDGEILFLKENYHHMTHKKIGIKINRSSNSIRNKCYELSLTDRKRFPPNIDERFCRLVVISKSKKIGKNNQSYYICLCDCGTIKEIVGHALKNGYTSSCGCYQKESRREVPGESGLKKMERRYKQKRKKHIVYELTTKQFRELIVQDCFWCGESPQPWNVYYNKDGSLTDKHISKEWADQQWIIVNGIDRINSGLGYTTDNCAPCCYECNRIKSDKTENEFLSRCYKIAAFQEKKKLTNAS
jgi:hypothetical protein